MKTKDIQKELKKQGYKPGPANGVWGRLTIGALKDFQKACGLEADGVLTTETVDVCSGVPSLESVEATPEAIPLVWYEEAVRQLGTREVPGPASNPKILQWAGQLGIPYKGDDIPWCGLFAAHCVGSTLPGETLPINPLGARNWAKFGAKCKPVLGSVLVFCADRRREVSDMLASITARTTRPFMFSAAINSTRSASRVARNRLLDARQPATVPLLTTGPLRRNKSGGLSSNEA
jgi:peptidoglycan hydrolase-like protein with peptidoglycan-binding domain